MKFTIALLAGLLMIGSAFAQQKEQRVALVIGNAAYKSSPLKNPVNDARAIASQLKSFGFDVTLKENLKIREIGSTYREFRTKIKPGATALVFYAGHGIQVKGQNYFPAVDAEIDAEEDVPLQSLNLGTLLENMEEAKAAVNLVFLDACRDNPFARRFRSASRGLAKVEAASGTLIHYATKPGSVAADGDGNNGTYTEALLAQLSSPLPVELMLKQVTNVVVTKTKGKQEPWVEGSLRGDFYFRSPTQTTDAVRPSPVVVPEMSAAQREDAFWADAKSAGNKEGFEGYLESYPKGRYVSLARANIARLSTANVQVVSAPPVVAPVISPPVTKLVIASPVRLPGGAFKDCDDCPEMVVIPAGEFLMGASNPFATPPPPANEQPQHKVTIRSFALGKMEVTQEQWYAVMGNNPSKIGGKSLPVFGMDISEVKKFIQKLSSKTGKNYRLPSEAEWEYSNRAGATTEYPFGDDPIVLSSHAWFLAQTIFNSSPYLQSPKLVGQKIPNRFGLFDMQGNVWELTEDCWNENYNGAPSDGSAWTTANKYYGCAPVARGGSVASGATLLRSSSRLKFDPLYAGFRESGMDDYFIGFRVARDN
jgi:formylglycine-generating enzyme required for sulfatase activity